MFLRILVVFSLALFSHLSIAAQQQSSPASAVLRHGEVIPRVQCAEKPEQTYALYLPSYFTPDRAWPVIFALDPAARGSLPVSLAKDAAEKYGFIVAGSNNAQNGPFTPTYQAAVAMADDVSRRFPVDTRRVYFTGFSGGARASVHVALFCQGCAAGVFLQGSGFPGDRPPTKEVYFPVFSAVGTLDFNYSEMVPLQDQLEELGIRHRLRRFEGPHRWAPPEIWVEAVEWLELAAVKQERRPRDDKFIGELLSRRLAGAREREAAGDIYAAWQEYRDIQRDFQGLANVSEATKEASKLATRREVQQGRDDEQREFAEEQRILRDFNLSFDHLFNQPAEYPLAQGEVQVQLQKLRKLREKEDGWKSRVAQRCFSQVTARVFEAGEERRRTQDYSDATTFFELLSKAAPENPGPYYQLARTYALAGKRKEALRSIEEALKRGFNRPDLLEHEDFAGLSGEPAFQDLVDAVRRKAESR